MKFSMKILCLISLSFVLIIIGCSSPKKKEEIKRIDSNSLEKTVITSHMEVDIKPRKNLLYCSAFQLVWNEFRDIEDTHLPNEPQVVKILDKKTTTKKDVSEDSYVVAIGKLTDSISAINKALKAKFKDEAPAIEKPDFSGFSEEAILAYAFLYKNLKFKDEFENLDSPIMFISDGKASKVKSFGIKKYAPYNKEHQLLSKQVSILDYKDNSDFIIHLNSLSPNDEIILAKIKPEKTLLQTIEKVKKRIENSKEDLIKEDEILQIPKFDFEITHSFLEIEKYLSRLAEGPAKAIQNIRFRLNEKGAILKSEARIVVEGEGFELPRRFVFNKPFLIYLRQKSGKYPYLAIWVDNPELLVKE